MGDAFPNGHDPVHVIDLTSEQHTINFGRKFGRRAEFMKSRERLFMMLNELVQPFMPSAKR